jgi:hypothetical protein
MSLLALIAAEQAKNKVEQGYTPLPEDANWFDTLYTSLSNVPNVASDMVGGLVGLATSSDARKQLHKSVSDFTLGTMEKLNDGPLFDTELAKRESPKRIETVDQAIAAVKNTLSSERNIQEFLSQNPDVFAGGVWGAGKLGGAAGKHLGPKLAEKVETHLQDQGLMTHIIPPDSKTFGKGDAYTSTEFMDLGKDVGDNLSDAAHKFRGDIGYMADPGYGKGISESSFVDLINQQGLAMKRSGVDNWEETLDLLQSKVGLDRMEEMLAGSAVVLEKPLYIERAEGFGGSKKTPVDVKDTSIYSATVVDPKNAALMNLKSPYGDNPYIVKLEAGTKIYHPGKNADLFEVVVRGKDVNKSQGIKKSDFKIKDERKLGDTLFNWDEIEKKTSEKSWGLGELDNIWKKAHKSNSVTDGLLGQVGKGTEVKTFNDIKKGDTFVTYHASPSSEIKDGKFEIRDAVHGGEGFPRGIHSAPQIKNTFLDLDSGEFGDNIYKLETTIKGDIFDVTNPDPKLVKKLQAKISDRYEDKSHPHIAYLQGKIENGSIPPELGREFLLENGIDTLRDGSERLISLNPENMKILEKVKGSSGKKRTKPANYKQGRLDLD